MCIGMQLRPGKGSRGGRGGGRQPGTLELRNLQRGPRHKRVRQNLRVLYSMPGSWGKNVWCLHSCTERTREKQRYSVKYTQTHVKI